MTKKWPYFDQIMTKKWPFFESERENNDQKMTFFNIFLKNVKMPYFLVNSILFHLIMKIGFFQIGPVSRQIIRLAPIV